MYSKTGKSISGQGTSGQYGAYGIAKTGQAASKNYEESKTGIRSTYKPTAFGDNYGRTK